MRVFPVEPNARDPLIETYGYMTELQFSWDGREKRIQKRRHPIEGMEYKFLFDDPLESEYVLSLLFDGQDEFWIVPLWQYASHPDVDIADTDTVVSIQTADVPFQDPIGLGTSCVLWKNRKTFQAHTIQSVSGSSVTFSDAVIGSWPKQSSWIIPCRIGLLESVVPISWHNPRGYGGSIKSKFVSSGAIIVGGPGDEGIIPGLGAVIGVGG